MDTQVEDGLYSTPARTLVRAPPGSCGNSAWPERIPGTGTAPNDTHGGADLHAASRYLTHVLVLVSAILVPSFALAQGGPHQAAILTSLAADRQAVQPDRGFIVKPAMTSATPEKHQVQTYSVQQGDTLLAIGYRFGISLDTLRWANGLSNLDTLALDQKLLIPPVDGVLITVKAGDTLAALAGKYQVPASSIVEFNLLRDPDHVAPGTQLMIPRGIGDALPEPAPAAPTAAAPGRTRTAQAGSPVIPHSYSGGNHFPWGWCTWYVASRRAVPWSGDAHAWYGNAQAFGYPTGRTPRPGAIMVTWESWWGHVAYVESVDGSCWTVSEMNYRGFGIMSYRHICPGQVPLIGFVY